jgi:hypothetical protein
MFEVQTPDGRWVGVLHYDQAVGVSDPDIEKAQQRIEAEIANARAKLAAEQRAAEEEPPVPTCSECGAVVGHTGTCSKGVKPDAT